MVELLEGIGHNIRRLRDEKGWNQTELGFHADTSPSIISLIENGKRNPSTATLAKIAGALGVEVVELFPKARSSSLEPSLFNGIEDEQGEAIYDVVLAAARRQAEQDRQAAARTLASERPQTYFMRHENEVVRRLLEYPPDELAGALVEMARRCVQLEGQLEHITEAASEAPEESRKA